MIKKVFICDNCGKEVGTYDQLSKLKRYNLDTWDIELIPPKHPQRDYPEWCDVCWKKKAIEILEKLWRTL